MAILLGEHNLLTKKVFETDENFGSKADSSVFVQGKESLEGKVVCLFFSASWCTPCQHFIPALKEVYSDLVQRNSPIEIVFLSFDKTEEEMMEYYKYKHGEWLAVKFGDPLKQELAERYSVSVIPKLIVIQPDGEVISSKGRKDVQDRGVVCMRAWQAGFDRHNHQEKELVDSENTLINPP